MSGWNGAKVGLKVNGGDKELAKQFLNILGANTEGCRFDEEIGKLDADFAPEITGIIGDRDSDPFDILRGLNDHADSYTEQYVSGSKVKAFTLLDGIYVVLQKILPGSYLYVAHETGNKTAFGTITAMRNKSIESQLQHFGKRTNQHYFDSNPKCW